MQGLLGLIATGHRSLADVGRCSGSDSESHRPHSRLRLLGLVKDRVTFVLGR